MIIDSYLPCDCGYGDGFYHKANSSMHEYNPNVSEEIACSELYNDRLPIAGFYGHINGHSIEVFIKDPSREEKIEYTTQKDKKNSMLLASQLILSLCNQKDLFK
jgi:hypothetical protein